MQTIPAVKSPEPSAHPLAIPVHEQQMTLGLAYLQVFDQTALILPHVPIWQVQS
jgi:hypothetical protein